MDNSSLMQAGISGLTGIAAGAIGVIAVIRNGAKDREQRYIKMYEDALSTIEKNNTAHFDKLSEVDQRHTDRFNSLKETMDTNSRLTQECEADRQKLRKDFDRLKVTFEKATGLAYMGMIDP